MSRTTKRNIQRYGGGVSTLTPTRIGMFIALTALMTIAVVGYTLYQDTMGANNPQLMGILSRVNKYGVLIDPAGEIGVNSAMDVGYRYKGKNLEIIYGKVTIKLPKDKIDEKTKEQLRRIKINLEDTDDKGREFKVLFGETEVQEYN